MQLRKPTVPRVVCTKRMAFNLFAPMCMFFVIACGGIKNELVTVSFDGRRSVEGPATAQNYLLKHDGSKVYGSKIKGRSGDLIKDWISIDNEKFKMSEIAGFKEDSTFYFRINNRYTPRVVKGKVNIYKQSVSSSSYDASTHSTSYREYIYYFVQTGDDTSQVYMLNNNNLKTLVADCPKAFEKVNYTAKELRKLIKGNKRYLNETLSLYNNNCMQ